MNIAKKSRNYCYWKEGSKNVFTDLGMPDAEEKLIKVKLALKINELISQKNLKQKDAAQLLQVDQSKISLLNRGRLSDFSVERLAHLLTLLNQDVEIVIKKSKTSDHGKLKVIYA